MRHTRFTLRTLMVGVIACGLLFWGVLWQGSPSYALVVASHSIIAWGLCLLTAFSLARTFGPTVRGPGRGAVAWLLLILVLPALLYLIWAHHRVARGDWSDLIHGFPYPDRAINALERWFDARHPVTTPGSIKLHGEYPRVAFVLGASTLAIATVAGFLLGLISHRRGGSPG